MYGTRMNNTSGKFRKGPRPKLIKWEHDCPCLVSKSFFQKSVNRHIGFHGEGGRGQS